MKGLRILLLVIAVVCIGVAVSYPIRYQRELKSNNEELADLSAMRRRVLEAESQEGTLDGDGGTGEKPPDDAPEAAGPREEGLDVPGAEPLPEGTDGAAEPGEPHTAGDSAVASVEPAEASGDSTAVSVEPAEAAGDSAAVSAEPTETEENNAAVTERPYLAAGDDVSMPEAADSEAGDHPAEPEQPAQPEQPAEGPPSQTGEPGSIDEGTPPDAEPEQPAEGPKSQTAEPGSIDEGTPPDAEPEQPVEVPQSQTAEPGSIDEGTPPDVEPEQPVEGPQSRTAEPGNNDEGTPPDAEPGQPAEVPQSQTGEPGNIEGTASPEIVPAGTLAPEGSEAARPSFTPPPTPIPDVMAFIINDPDMVTPTPSPSPTPTPTPSPSPSPTPDRTIRTGALAYKYLEKVELDPSKILPELQEIYEINQDLVGWISIEDTLIDYPVVQCKDSEYYLKHDFYGKNNANGQIILDTKCDPYTPSYNLVISGHHMNSGAMFGKLPLYRDKKYWEKHKVVEFDTLMERKKYVIFAVFYSADYDEDETGFRYNADIQYKLEAEQWLEEIKENQIYDTGFHARFGDEFITLTTCDRSRRRNGRFVAVARRIREGERII